MTNSHDSFAKLLNDSIDTDVAHSRQPPLNTILHERPRRGGVLALWRVPILTAAIVGLLIVGTVTGVSQLTGRNDSKVGSLSAPSSGTMSAPSPSLTSQSATVTSTVVGSIQRVGQAGPYSWVLGSDGLGVLGGGSTAWIKNSLPTGVTPASVQNVAISSAGNLYISVPIGGSFAIYQKPSLSSAAWSQVTLTPTWPAGSQLSGPPSSTMITPEPGNLVVVVASLQAGSTTSATSLFVSADGGKTFSQRALGLTDTFSSVGFLSAEDGVVVEGPTADEVFHTSDGGMSWVPSVIPTPAAGSYATYKTPIVVGNNLEIPTVVTDGDFTAHVSYYISTDGGATFPVATGPAITIPSSENQLSLNLAESGTTRWIVPGAGHTLYASSDSGTTWNAITSPSLPPGVGSLNLLSSNQATLATKAGSCTGDKTGCTSVLKVYSTTDAGHTWTPS